MKPFDNVVVSATEPNNKADVWIQHSKNLYKGQSLQNGLWISNGNIGGNSSGWYIIVPIKGGLSYTVTRKNGKTVSSYLSLGVTSTAEYPKEGTSIIDTWITDSVNGKKITIQTTAKANYLLIGLAAGNISQVTTEVQQLSVEELMVEVGAEKKEYEAPVEDDILVNNNGVYNSVLTQDITTGAEFKTNKKIDGKDIYYKRIDLGTGPTSTSKTYPIGINFNNIIDSNVFAKDSTASFKLPFLAQSSQEFINYYFQSTNIIIQAGKDRSGYNFYLDIYYIK